jgi:uncharacterized protein (DUF58 family)
MIRPRRRAAGLVVGAAVLFTVGTSVQAGWLLLLSALLLGVAIVGSLLPGRMVRGLEVERRAPAEAFQGDEVPVEVVVVNRGRGTKLSVEVEDEHVARTQLFLDRVGPGERLARGTARRAARRGVQEGSTASVRSAAPFGVAERRRTLPVPGTTVVYPAVVELGDLPLLASVPSHEHAIHGSPRRGHGPEYLGIREYRTGDSLRHVHWPSTARTGTMMVREFEEERTRRLAIVVDTWADAGTEETPLDVCCSAAASVALAAVGLGRGVRLFAAREGVVDALVRSEPPELLRWLAEIRPFGGVPLAGVAAWLGPELRGIESVLLAAPTWRANAGAELAVAIEALTSSVEAVAVLLVDAGTFPADRRAPALDEAGVDALAEDLEARGATVYRHRAGEDLATCLRRSLVPAR